MGLKKGEGGRAAAVGEPPGPRSNLWRPRHDATRASGPNTWTPWTNRTEPDNAARAPRAVYERWAVATVKLSIPEEPVP